MRAYVSQVIHNLRRTVSQDILAMMNEPSKSSISYMVKVSFNGQASVAWKVTIPKPQLQPNPLVDTARLLADDCRSEGTPILTPRP